MNQTKTISLTIKVPSEYRYLAQQPFGDFYLFKERPFIFKDMNGSEFWGIQEGEMAILGDNSVLKDVNVCLDWKDSVKDLG